VIPAPKEAGEDNMSDIDESDYAVRNTRERVNPIGGRNRREGPGDWMDTMDSCSGRRLASYGICNRHVAEISGRVGYETIPLTQDEAGCLRVMSVGRTELSLLQRIKDIEVQDQPKLTSEAFLIHLRGSSSSWNFSFSLALPCLDWTDKAVN
jgi:hypothetical protein